MFRGWHRPVLCGLILSHYLDLQVISNTIYGEVLVYLGSSNSLERYKIYVAHVREWRQQFSKLESVYLLYDRHIILFFFFNETATPEFSTLPLPDPFPI